MKGVAVGVDAGGTSTRAALSRDGTFVKEYAAAGASVSALGIDEASRRLAHAIEAVSGEQAPHAIYIGAAGAGRPGVAEQLEAALGKRFSGAQIRVVDDARIALRAFAPSGPGIALIAGTGSIAYAEDEAGQSHRAGGYGYLLGDDGSGFAIGLAAARQLARVLDGRGPEDELTAALRRRLEISTQPELFDRIYLDEKRVAVLASLAQPVIELAGAGVRSANKIVQAAALELADLVKVVAKKSGLQNATVPLVFSGGLFKENSVLTFLLETRLQSDLPGAEINKQGVEAHRGALRAAEAMLP